MRPRDVQSNTRTQRRPPKIGVYVNNRAAVFLGPEYTIASMIELAKLADEAGLDFVAVGDSILAKPRFSPIVTLAAIASVTENIELTTGILQPHMRHPVLLAQEWATLDTLAEGRTSLAVGLGTGPRDLVDAELSLVGLHRASRAQAFEESIVVLKKLWDGGSVSFRGSIYRLENVDVGFTPARRGGPKIIIACGAFIPRDADTGPNDIYSPRIAGKFLAPLDRVARLGDGWITGMTKPEEWRDLWDRLRSEGERLGRDLDSPDFERRLNCFLHVGPDAEARREGREFLERYHRRPMDQETLDRWLFAGPAGYCAEQIGRFVEVGVNSFQLVLASAKQKEQLERLVEDVLPFVRTGVSASDSSQPGRRRGERLPAPGGEVMSHGSFRR